MNKRTYNALIKVASIDKEAANPVYEFLQRSARRAGNWLGQVSGRVADDIQDVGAGLKLAKPRVPGTAKSKAGAIRDVNRTTKQLEKETYGLDPDVIKVVQDIIANPNRTDADMATLALLNKQMTGLSYRPSKLYINGGAIYNNPANLDFYNKHLAPWMDIVDVPQVNKMGLENLNMISKPRRHLRGGHFYYDPLADRLSRTIVADSDRSAALDRLAELNDGVLDADIVK
jgi:hypothetical protein